MIPNPPPSPYVSSNILTKDILNNNDSKKQQLLQQLLHQQSHANIPHTQVKPRSSIYIHEQHNHRRLTLTRRDLNVINNDDDKHSYRRNEYYI